MAGLINAFSSGFLEGTRAGALMDATWAAQDEREQAAKDRIELDSNMKEFADYLEQAGGNAVGTPEGQQILGRVIMGNPEVSKAVNSNPGHQYAGVVKNPKKEDEYYLTVRNGDGSVRPVTVNREKGGVPVAYTGQQLVNMAASSLVGPGVDTPEFRQKLGLSSEGDLFQAVSARYPSMGTPEQVRAAAEQGRAFISEGGVPQAKTGVAGVKSALKMKPSPIEEEEEEEESTEVEAQEAPSRAFVPARQQSFSEANLDRMLAQKPELSVKEQKEAAIAARTPFGKVGEFTTQMMQNSGSDNSAPITGERTAPGFDAYAVGQMARKVGSATADNIQQNIVEPVSNALGGVSKAAGDFMAALQGKERVAEQPKTEEPVAPATMTQNTPKQKPRDTAEIAVERQNIPSKAFSNPVHIEKLDKVIGAKVASEPLAQRVATDGEALDKLVKASTGSRPNSRALYLGMRLVKSGLLTSDQFATFRETGKLDNVEFENAYKEQAARQGWVQLDLAKQRLNFDQFKEQMDQQRHMQSQTLQRLKLFAEQSGKNAATADKQAAKVYKGVHSVLTADFMARMNQSKEFKDASSGDVKFYAEAAATRLLGDPVYVRSLLRDSDGNGRDIMAISDAEHLRPAVKQLLPIIVGEGFFSKGTNLPLPTDFAVNPRKLLKGE